LLIINQKDAHFEKDEKVLMSVEEMGANGAYYTTSKVLVIRAKRLRNGSWQYQLDEESGERYMDNDWFSERDLSDA
jgi:hypothetical protein